MQSSNLVYKNSLLKIHGINGSSKIVTFLLCIMVVIYILVFPTSSDSYKLYIYVKFFKYAMFLKPYNSQTCGYCSLHFTDEKTGS